MTIIINKETRSYKIETITELLGTVPKDPIAYGTYIGPQKPDTVIEDVVDEKEIDNIHEKEKGWTGFMSDDKGLFIYSYMVTGFLKNTGEVLARGDHGITVQKERGTKGNKTVEEEKLKGIRGKIDRYVFTSPRKLYFNRTEPDGVLERPIRIMLPTGPRVSVTKSDYMNPGLQLEFSLTLINNKEVTWDIIEGLFAYGEFAGLGQWRSGGHGRFVLVS